MSSERLFERPPRHHPVPLCAVCGENRAVKIDLIDDRWRPSCGCVDNEVPEPPALDERIGTRIARVLRWNPGATADELREILNIPKPSEDQQQNQNFQAHLSRLVKRGVVESRDERDIRGSVRAVYTLIGEVKPLGWQVAESNRRRWEALKR